MTPAARLGFLIAAFILLGMLGACSRQDSSEVRPKAPGSSPDVPTVAVAQATRENLSRDVVLTAEFRPFQEVDVMAKVAGYIRKINVDSGDHVRQGDLLATLEIPEMADDQRRAEAAIERSQSEVARAQDELRRAEAGRDIAHLSYGRLEGVSKQRPGLVAQQELDDAQSKDLTAEAQVAAARSSLAAAQQQVHVYNADLARVKTMLEYTRVTAPFTGVITKRYADTGAMIQAGTASNTQTTPLVRLSENSLLRLILPVPESAVPTVHIGQRVDVVVSTLNRKFAGKVARFVDKVSMATRTMDTEVDVPNPDGLLIPGMYAEVHLSLERRDGAIAVPVAAVDFGNGGAESSVTVVTPENRTEVRKIETGLETADKVEVKSGVREKELVVVGARSGLQSGQEVRPHLASPAVTPPPAK